MTNDLQTVTANELNPNKLYKKVEASTLSIRSIFEADGCEEKIKFLATEGKSTCIVLEKTNSPIMKKQIAISSTGSLSQDFPNADFAECRVFSPEEAHDICAPLQDSPMIYIQAWGGYIHAEEL